jgi:hypothetical protein
VTFTITARNASNTVQNLSFSSGQSYDIMVRPQGQSDAEPLWQWSRGRMFTQAMREISLNAGEQRDLDDDLAANRQCRRVSCRAVNTRSVRVSRPTAALKSHP